MDEELRGGGFLPTGLAFHRDRLSRIRISLQRLAPDYSSFREITETSQNLHKSEGFVNFGRSIECFG